MYGLQINLAHCPPHRKIKSLENLQIYLSAQNAAHTSFNSYLATGANKMCSNLQVNCKTGCKLFNVHNLV